MEPILLLGLACVAYTLIELAGAARRTPHAARSADWSFGAVDADTGRPIVTVCDRRRPGRADRRSRALPIAV